jgi:fructose-bisphosphate aldolase class II
MVDAVLRAAQTHRSPVIVGLAERHFEKVNPWLIAGAVVKGAERVDVPLAFHLDHANSLESVKLGIELGCTSVMIDGSHLAFEENVQLTSDVAVYSHSKNVSVEAELGAVGGVEGDITGGEDPGLYTDPEAAEVFVRRTGVDALAVAIGTVHGMYRSKPRLRFDLVKQIARKTNACLVLHGGSGLSTSDFQRLIAAGITKINVFTEMSLQSAERIRQNLSSRTGPVGITEILNGVTEQLSQVAGELIKTFGSARR